MEVRHEPKAPKMSNDRSQVVNNLPEEALIAKYLRGKPLTEIVAAYSNAITRYAREKDFERAERLREKLIAAAPLAVAEIVKTAEIIESEKTSAIDYEQIKPWAGLFNTFSPSEAAAFYFALREIKVKAHQPVFRQGNCDNRLYFIASGKFKLSFFHPRKKETVVFAELGPRHICGLETFFTHTTHSTNLVAMEDSRILCLAKKDFQKLASEHPVIQSKLIKYCETHQRKFEFFKQDDILARRAHQRFETELKGEVHRIDSKNRMQLQSMKITVVDISAGGLSYLVSHMRIGDAANLHQSMVHVTVNYRKDSTTYQISRIARVVGVRFLPFGECSVHLQFQERLEECKVMDIAQQTNVTTYV